MKTIALSMIFSLVVIVCEGQTLFAPAFVKLGDIKGDFKAANSTNSLVPIAGVNRSVPLAGASYNPGKGASRAIVHPQYSPSGPDRKPTVDGAIAIPALMRPDRGNSLEHGPGMHDSLHDDSAFLPWHRGYFGLGGSAERILGEAKDETHKDW
jgi:hypothetical protein